MTLLPFESKNDLVIIRYSLLDRTNDNLDNYLIVDNF